MKHSEAVALVLAEVETATAENKPMASPYEGYAVILEELDELWEAVKADNGAKHQGVSEAVQVAAAALRYLIDVCPKSAAGLHTVKKETYRIDNDKYGGYSG